MANKKRSKLPKKEAVPKTNELNEESKDSLTQLEYVKPSKNTPRQVSQERKSSGIYSQLTQEQISVLRDSFALIDDDNDGIISDDDLIKAFQLINKDVSLEEREDMFSQVQDPLAFGGFLSSLAGKLGELSTRQELIAGFEVFNVDEKTPEGEGQELRCDVKELKETLLLAGMTEDEVELSLKNFVKTEMDGREIFLAERFVNTVRD